MAGFFSNLFDKITSAFKSKDLDDNINNFQSKIDTIINDLLLPYTQPDSEFSKNSKFMDMINLLDPKKCNKIALTLSSNLDKNYTKLQIEQFASSILIGNEQKECNDDTCESNSIKNINNKTETVSKKEICNSVAVHYVKIMNLIAAVLTAVNPSDNICLNRLRNLLTIINEDENNGVSAICDITNSPVKNTIMNEPGMKQLLMLYYYHLIQDTETEEEKENIRNQYTFLVKTFTNMVMFMNPESKNENLNNININDNNEGGNNEGNEGNEEGVYF